MVLTDNEKRELALEVLRLLKEQSIGVNELPKATTMDGVGALPAYQIKEGVSSAVAVPISLLGKPALDAAAEAKEVIEQTKGAITDTKTAINSVNSAIEDVNVSKNETENVTKNAVIAIENLNKLKEALHEIKEAAEKATKSAYRASDDADNISDLVSKEWQNIKNEAEKITEVAQMGVEDLNQVLKETNELIGSVNDKLVTKEEKLKWNDKYTQSEVDSKDNAILDSVKQYVINRVAEVIGGSPAALDTLYEIANALNNDPHFATTIMAMINGKADNGHKHTKSQITDFPSSMPASDVSAWAKASSKPAYTAAEVGAATIDHNHNNTYAPASHEHDTIKGNYTGNGGKQPPSYIPSGKVRFNMMNTSINGDGNYKDFLMMDTYSGGDVPVATAFGISKSTALRAFIMQGVKGGDAWNRTAEIFTTANFNPANYATAIHDHSADQISDTSEKVIMTATERSKLAGIESSANKYVHPSTHAASMVSQDATHRFVTDIEKTKWNNSSPVVSKNSNGYIKIGGIIFQWGVASGTTWKKNISFPIPFPTTCCSVVCSSQYDGASGKGYNNVANITRTGCTLIIDNAPGCWLAIGY